MLRRAFLALSASALAPFGMRFKQQKSNPYINGIEAWWDGKGTHWAGRQDMAEWLDTNGNIAQPPNEVYVALRRTGALIFKQHVVWASWQPRAQCIQFPVRPAKPNPNFVDNWPDMSPVGWWNTDDGPRKVVHWDRGSYYKVPGFSGFCQAQFADTATQKQADQSLVGPRPLWIYAGEDKPYQLWFEQCPFPYRWTRAPINHGMKPHPTRTRYSLSIRHTEWPSDRELSRYFGIPCACDTPIPF